MNSVVPNVSKTFQLAKASELPVVIMLTTAGSPLCVNINRVCWAALTGLTKARELSADLRKRIMDSHNCRLQGHQLKQLLVKTSFWKVQALFQATLQKVNPTCHPKLRENLFGCSRTKQKPLRHMPALKAAETQVSASTVKPSHGLRGCCPRSTCSKTEASS